MSTLFRDAYASPAATGAQSAITKCQISNNKNNNVISTLELQKLSTFVPQQAG
jgi:hypothetical protein